MFGPVMIMQAPVAPRAGGRSARTARRSPARRRGAGRLRSRGRARRRSRGSKGSSSPRALRETMRGRRVPPRLRPVACRVPSTSSSASIRPSYRCFSRLSARSLRAQDLVLEDLQLRRDVTFGALQRLPSRVVRRRPVRLALADLDVIAVHAVVADLQRADSGALLLPRLEIEQVPVRVVAMPRSSSSSSSKPGGNDAAVADQHRRIVDQRALQQLALPRMRGRHAGRALATAANLRDCNRFFKRGQARQREQELPQVARPRGTQRDARRGCVRRRRYRAAAAAAIRRQTRRAGSSARPGNARASVLLSRRGRCDPAPQQAAAHRALATVHDASQRMLATSAQVFLQFQVARVGPSMMMASPLRSAAMERICGRAVFCVSLDVLQQGAGRGDAAAANRRSRSPRGRCVPNCAHSRRVALSTIEMPGRPARHADAPREHGTAACVLVDDDLRGLAGVRARRRAPRRRRLRSGEKRPPARSSQASPMRAPAGENGGDQVVARSRRAAPRRSACRA